MVIRYRERKSGASNILIDAVQSYRRPDGTPSTIIIKKYGRKDKLSEKGLTIELIKAEIEQMNRDNLSSVSDEDKGIFRLRKSTNKDSNPKPLPLSDLISRSLWEDLKIPLLLKKVQDGTQNYQSRNNKSNYQAINYNLDAHLYYLLNNNLRRLYRGEHEDEINCEAIKTLEIDTHSIFDFSMVDKKNFANALELLEIRRKRILKHLFNCTENNLERRGSTIVYSCLPNFKKSSLKALCDRSKYSKSKAPCREVLAILLDQYDIPLAYEQVKIRELSKNTPLANKECYISKSNKIKNSCCENSNCNCECCNSKEELNVFSETELLGTQNSEQALLNNPIFQRRVLERFSYLGELDNITFKACNDSLCELVGDLPLATNSATAGSKRKNKIEEGLATLNFLTLIFLRLTDYLTSQAYYNEVEKVARKQATLTNKSSNSKEECCSSLSCSARVESQEEELANLAKAKKSIYQQSFLCNNSCCLEQVKKTVEQLTGEDSLALLPTSQSDDCCAKGSCEHSQYKEANLTDEEALKLNAKAISNQISAENFYPKLFSSRHELYQMMDSQALIKITGFSNRRQLIFQAFNRGSTHNETLYKCLITFLGNKALSGTINDFDLKASIKVKYRLSTFTEGTLTSAMAPR